MRKVGIKISAVLALAIGIMLSPDASGQNSQKNPLPHFIFPEFREGLVVMKEGKPFTAMLNYNLLEQRMVTELNGTYRYSRDPAIIDTIYIGERVFVPVDRIFYELLSSGEYTFYIQNRATFVPAGQEVGYGVKSQSTGPTRYSRFEMAKPETDVAYYGEVVNLDLPPEGEVKSTSVFWVDTGSELKKFTTARQLIKIMPGYKTEIQQYLDKHRVNFKSPGDVALLGDYLNSIAGGKK